MSARAPLKLAVVGDPVAHSRSPVLQRGFMAEAGVEGTYEAIRVRAGELGAAVAALRAEGYGGLNVTTPLKEEAAALCDRLSPAAQALGAVNTLVFRPLEIFGANTDGAGGVGALEAALGDTRGKRVLVLGAGPTARAVVYALARAGADVSIWNRTHARAQTFAERFGVRVWDENSACDAVYATLPPDADVPPAVERALAAAPVVLDANYGPRATLGAQLGRPVIDGAAMLAASSRRSFELWSGKLDEWDV
jgi:shikimate dehydrogenase